MKNENYPIDFVVTWVDGNDPVWQAEKAKYSPNKNADNRNVRYRDWDNMQYWFRAVEKFAPWVNKVHFVTYGHLPKWLNTDCPKLNIVKHSDFIPSQYLPTFSSRSIELNIHRIHGLSDKFIYFNDDMFILNNTSTTTATPAIWYLYFNNISAILAPAEMPNIVNVIANETVMIFISIFN